MHWSGLTQLTYTHHHVTDTIKLQSDIWKFE